MKYIFLTSSLCLSACNYNSENKSSMEKEDLNSQSVSSNVEWMTISKNLKVNPKQLGIAPFLNPLYINVEYSYLKNLIAEYKKNKPHDTNLDDLDDKVFAAVAKYKEFMKINSIYSKAMVVNCLDQIDNEAIEKAKKDKSIEVSEDFSKMNAETTFEAQLSWLDFSKLKSIVFCWPNSYSAYNPIPLPLSTCCRCDHEVVNLEDSEPTILYADKGYGINQVSKFDIKDIKLWELVKKKLGGKKISSIVDCSDGNWSEFMGKCLDNRLEYYIIHDELIKVTKYILDNILKENGVIKCGIHVKDVVDLDYEAFFAHAKK